MFLVLFHLIANFLQLTTDITHDYVVEIYTATVVTEGGAVAQWV